MIERMTSQEIALKLASEAEHRQARVRDIAREIRTFRHFLMHNGDADDYEPFTLSEATSMAYRRFQCLLFEEFGGEYTDLDE